MEEERCETSKRNRNIICCVTVFGGRRKNGRKTPAAAPFQTEAAAGVLFGRPFPPVASCVCGGEEKTSPSDLCGDVRQDAVLILMDGKKRDRFYPARDTLLRSRKIRRAVWNVSGIAAVFRFAPLILRLLFRWC